MVSDLKDVLISLDHIITKANNMKSYFMKEPDQNFEMASAWRDVEKESISIKDMFTLLGLYQEHFPTPLNEVTRVEVIDEDGRSYSNWDAFNKVSIDYQDFDKTIKIFISKETKMG